MNFKMNFETFGRIILFLPFVLFGIGKIIFWNDSIQFIGAHGMAYTSFFLLWAVLLEIVGGTLLVLNLFPRVGTICLMVFLVPATFIFHNFWSFTGSEMLNQMLHFFKNLSIFGGLVYYYIYLGRRCTPGCCK